MWLGVLFVVINFLLVPERRGGEGGDQNGLVTAVHKVAMKKTNAFIYLFSLVKVW